METAAVEDVEKHPTIKETGNEVIGKAKNLWNNWGSFISSFLL
jgi:hypothetical protein